MSKNTKGIVYIIENDFGLFKIGITRRSVDDRLSDIVSSSGVPAKVIKHFYSDQMQRVESILHSHHCDYRVVGEWFWKVDWDFVSKLEQNIDYYNDTGILEIDVHVQKELKNYPIITWSDLRLIKSNLGTKTKGYVLKNTLEINGYTKTIYKGTSYWSTIEINEVSIQEYFQNKTT